jgi:hypothetical protein
MMLQRFGVLLAFVALVSASFAAPAVRLPPPGADRDWDIMRRSTEALSHQANKPDGGQAVRNLYEAYARFKGRKSLSFQDCATINGILRQGGAEGGHVQDAGGGQLRAQDVGFYKDGQKVIDFPAWQTLPEKAKYLDELLRGVSTKRLSRDEVLGAATEAHLVIGKQQLFSDGNHRTARVVSDWILVRHGLPPADHASQPRDSYEVELRVTLKGAREVFLQHMQKAVAAAEASRGGNRAPPAAGGAPTAAPADKPFGKTDWTQDSPELQSPVQGGGFKIFGLGILAQHMRLAIGSGVIYHLDGAGRIWATAAGKTTPFSSKKGAVAIDCLADKLIVLFGSGQLAYIEAERLEPLLPDRKIVSFQVSAKERLYAVQSDGLVLEYDGQKWRSLARIENAVMAAIDEGSLLFAMSANGNVFRRVSGQWQMIDDGTGSRQIEASNGQLYVLKEGGNVWRSGDILKAPRWEKIDDGTGTRQIAIDGDDVYVLKGDGRLWRFEAAASRWQGLSPAGARLVAMRVRDGVAAGLTEDGKVVGLQDAPRRSATRRQQFEQLMPE